MTTNKIGLPRSLDHLRRLVTNARKYDNLIRDMAWFFETEDALRTVRSLVSQGKCCIGTYRELAIWAGDIESQLRKKSGL